MPRKGRIEFAGALQHIMCRGDRRKVHARNCRLGAAAGKSLGASAPFHTPSCELPFEGEKRQHDQTGVEKKSYH